jgi:hypothetical protein
MLFTADIRIIADSAGLVVNEAARFERSRGHLAVGLSCARDQLVVCGDPDLIREVGGPDLARRLNVSPT